MIFFTYDEIETLSCPCLQGNERLDPLDVATAGGTPPSALLPLADVPLLLPLSCAGVAYIHVATRHQHNLRWTVQAHTAGRALIRRRDNRAPSIWPCRALKSEEIHPALLEVSRFAFRFNIIGDLI